MSDPNTSINVSDPLENDTLQLSVQSTSRDVFVHPTSSFFTLEFATNPLNQVKQIIQGECVIPKTEYNVIRQRSITWRLGSEGASVVHTTTINPAFLSATQILALIQTDMATESGQTVLWTLENQKCRCRCDVDLILFPDVPTSTSSTLWDYTTTSFMKILGFNPATGLVTVPSGVEATNGFLAPNLADVSGNNYLLIRLLANGTPLGSVYEFNANREMVGPFFGKAVLATAPGSVAYTFSMAGKHTFLSPMTIYKLTLELISPIVGTEIRQYNLNGQDWVMNLNIVHGRMKQIN